MNESVLTPDSTPRAGLWAQAIVSLPLEAADRVSDELMLLGALAVSLEDANADTDEEQPLFGEPGMEPSAHAWANTRVLALFKSKSDGEALLAELPQGSLDGADIAWEDVPEQDWVRLTQSQFEPIEITPRLWIVPTWHEPVTGDARINLRLDPGLAFGTGSHPTTRLCLQWLSDHPLQNTTVLDYGCGSGILAIAALKLGAKHAVGVDIDPQAVISSEFNAEQNGVTLTAGLPDHPAAAGTFPLVVANILSNPLKVLAPTLCAHVAPGGHLVLSGVLERQAQEVAAAYAQWIALSVWRSHEGWVCLAGQKASA